MERNKYLLKNTTMIGLGSIISKFTQFVVLSLCTRCMTTSEYGIADICVSTAALLFPLFSLDISESVFRFTMDKPKSYKQIISLSICTTVLGGVIAFLFTPIAKFIPQIGDYWVMIALLSLFESLQLLAKEYARGRECGKLYVIGGVINSFAQISGCIFLVYLLTFGIWGYIVSLCFGYVAEFLFFAFAMDFKKNFSFFSIEKNYSKDMFSYSLPLIPNTIMWWIAAISDRYFILYMIGASAAGLYSVAAKIPALITIVTGIFFKAWQMSAIDIEKQKDKQTYSSNIFKYLWIVGAIGIAIILILLQPILFFLVAEDYYDAWIYSTILIVAAGFASIQSFFGTSYTVQKDSIGCLKSTSFMALLNLFLNYVLIRLLGIQGAALATLLSYMFISIYRYIDTKKYIKISIDFGRFFCTYALLIISAIIPLINLKLFYPASILSLILIVLINRSAISFIFQMMKSIIAKRIR